MALLLEHIVLHVPDHPLGYADGGHAKLSGRCEVEGLMLECRDSRRALGKVDATTEAARGTAPPPCNQVTAEAGCSEYEFTNVLEMRDDEITCIARYSINSWHR